MIRLRNIFVLALICATAPSARADDLALMLRGRDAILDQSRLLEAVRIHTSDLRVRWQTEVLLDERARFTCWTEARRLPGGLVRVTASLLPAGAPRAEAFSVEGALGDDLYRALALKLRSALSSAIEPPPTPSAPGPVLPPTVPSVAALEVGYSLTLADPVAATRHGVDLAALLALGPRFELGVALTAGERITSSSASGYATAGLTPVRFVARLTLARAPLGLAIGARAGLCVIDADGTSFGGARGTGLRAVALVGGELVVRFELGARVALQLGATVEVLLPHERFLINGGVALDVGTLGLGLVAALRVAL